MYRSTFQYDSVEQILVRLKAAGSAGEGSEERLWAEQTLALLTGGKLSPTSLRVTLEALKRGRDMSLRECLGMEFRLMMRCMASADFLEGIRAVLVDKDGSPNWTEVMSPADVQAYFVPLSDLAHEPLLPQTDNGTDS